MLFRTSLFAAAASFGLTAAAFADPSITPTILDDQALDSITAGFYNNSISAYRLLNIANDGLSDVLSTAAGSSRTVYIEGSDVLVYSPATGLVLSFEHN